MSLLVDLMQHAEDPAYAAAQVARTAPSGRPDGAARRPSRAVQGVAVLAAAGLLTGVAAAAVRSSGDGASRAGLLDEVQRRTAGSDRLTAQATQLRADVATRRDAALAGTEAARLQALEQASASLPVTGPGLVARLDDRPPPQDADPTVPRGGQIGLGRVLDRDLQLLVNGLWAAGAEAVSINDQRLTARTAIRSAGEAVLVDYRPLSPPYVVRAIGAPGQLEPSFVDGVAGRQLSTYTSLYGLRFSVTSSADLHLPAGAVLALRSAVPGPS